MLFRDRQEAGRLLADRLLQYRGKDVVVLALPRGGLAVAQPVAKALGAPLDVIVSRKIGAPGHEEFAIGAITARGTRVLNTEALRRLLLPPGYLEAASEDQRHVAERREAFFRGVRSQEPLAGKIAVLVDDGVATGMTLLAAIEDVRDQRPESIVVAAPVIAPDAYQRLGLIVDDVVALAVPENFMAIGQFYRDFTQVSDDEAKGYMAAALNQA